MTILTELNLTKVQKSTNESHSWSPFQVQHIDEILAEVGPGESNKEEEEEDWEDVQSSGDEEEENGKDNEDDGKMDES